MRKIASLVEAAGIAWQSLTSSKLRSFLTLLGIILSTSTLIAVMSVVHGMNTYVADKIADLGADGFIITRMAFFGDFSPKKYIEFLKKNPQLSPEEFRFIKEHATLLKEVGMRSGTGVPVSYSGRSLKQVNLTGGTSNLNLLTNLQLESGRYFTDGEDRSARPVAVIGQDLKEEFFPTADPIGKIITADGKQFEVIGVGKKIGSVFGQSQDNFLQVPMTVFFKMYGNKRWISYVCQAAGHGNLFQAIDEVRALLRARRHVSPGADDNFGLVTSEAILSTWERLTAAIAASAVAVVSVFMVVGGVVIMNIMLAVVTERTMEIGIRKAIGASRGDILRQFLIESSVLSASGGVLGVSIAWIAAVLVRNLTPVPMAVPVSAVVIGVTLSTVVGLFFGIYPARRAARLDPIEALRAEK